MIITFHVITKLLTVRFTIETVNIFYYDIKNRFIKTFDQNSLHCVQMKAWMMKIHNVNENVSIKWLFHEMEFELKWELTMDNRLMC